MKVSLRPEVPGEAGRFVGRERREEKLKVLYISHFWGKTGPGKSL